jgi:hypothetical protein
MLVAIAEYSTMGIRIDRLSIQAHLNLSSNILSLFDILQFNETGCQLEEEQQEKLEFPATDQ